MGRDEFIIICNFIEKLHYFNEVLHRHCLLLDYIIFWTTYSFNYMKFVMNIKVHFTNYFKSRAPE